MSRTVDIEPWKRQQSGYKKRRRDIWIHYEVGRSDGTRLLIVDHRSSWLTFGPPAMTASQMRIAETIDAFYGDAGTHDGVSRSYKQAVEDLDAETIKALDGPYRLVDWLGGE